jgi:P-type Mg2+ transporter
MLLVQVAGVLTAAIFVINVALHRPVIDALLFSLAIAVGISPQLLPAVMSTSLAAGSRQLARRKVWSCGWCASRISVTSTCCSPTRRAP